MTQPKKKSKSKQTFIPIDGESWKPVPRLPLEASNLGRIRNRQTGAILPATAGKYPRVTFTKQNGKVVTMEVHRLVGLAFFGPLAPGMDVHHRNHNKADCRLRNLKVVTHQQNCQEALKSGRLKTKLKPEDIGLIRSLLAANVSVKPIAAAFGVKPNTIHNVAKGRSWRSILSAK